MFSSPAHALSARHHVYNMARSLAKAISAPVEGVFVKGPQNIKKTWDYEVWGRENEAERGRWKYRVFAVWRAPGDEVKGIIDGVTTSVKETGNFVKELLSIFFSD